MLGSQEKKKLVAFASRAAKQFPSNSLDKINLLKSYQEKGGRERAAKNNNRPVIIDFEGLFFSFFLLLDTPSSSTSSCNQSKGWIVGDMQISNLFTRGRSVGQPVSGDSFRGPLSRLPNQDHGLFSFSISHNKIMQKRFCPPKPLTPSPPLSFPVTSYTVSVVRIQIAYLSLPISPFELA